MQLIILKRNNVGGEITGQNMFIKWLLKLIGALPLGR